MAYKKVCLPKSQYDNVKTGIQKAVVIYDQDYAVDEVIDIYCADDDSAPIKVTVTNVTTDIDICECSVLVSIELYDGSDSDKHWHECRLISEYEEELKKLRQEVLNAFNSSSENFSKLINFLD